jgi:hypothetical protein
MKRALSTVYKSERRERLNWEIESPQLHKVV